MAETFRTTKLEKFIQSKADFMRSQQIVIEEGKKQNLPVDILQYSQITLYNYTFDLCHEFGIEMPVIPGLTPGK